ncbi:MAG: hypothetical protein P8X96_16595 [Desulfobacteraceae bacterium]
MYKCCPSCGFKWPEREDLLADENITLVGYQANFKRPEAGLILFNHRCKGTLALYAEDFADLHDGPVFVKKALGTEKCPGHCLRVGDIRPCPVECECAYVRNILQKIEHWPRGRAMDDACAGSIRS